MLQQVEALEMEISRLRGEVEVQNHVLEQIKKRQRDLYTDIDQRLQRIEIPQSGSIDPLTGAAEPPLQTLSPFSWPEEIGGGQQTDTPLTLELVEQVPEDGATHDETASAAVPPAQPAEPGSGLEEAVTAVTPEQDMTMIPGAGPG